MSSDSEDDTKPPPMINIGVDLKVNNLVSPDFFAIVLYAYIFPVKLNHLKLFGTHKWKTFTNRRAQKIDQVLVKTMKKTAKRV